MHTKDKLAQALKAIQLDDMADKAAIGYYHDFLSPLDFPEIQLVNDLAEAAKRLPLHYRGIMALRQRVIDGEFDASTEESEEWARSPEGQAAMASLVGRKKPKRTKK